MREESVAAITISTIFRDIDGNFMGISLGEDVLSSLSVLSPTTTVRSAPFVRDDLDAELRCIFRGGVLAKKFDHLATIPGLKGGYGQTDLAFVNAARIVGHGDEYGTR